MLAVLLTIFLCILSESRSEQCYANNPQPYQRMGQKSSYFINANLAEEEIRVEGCEPELLWYLGRHGARKPSDTEIEDYAVRAPELQARIVLAGLSGLGQLCLEDIDNLDLYTFDLTVADHKLLMESGAREQEELGARWRKRLPSLIKDPELMQTRATYKQRTYASAEAFLRGAYPDDNVTYPHVIVNDMLLRFYEFCPAYIEGVDGNNHTFEEKWKFMEEPAYQDMVLDVSARVGTSLSVSDVMMAWNLCRYELAEFPDTSLHISPWCAIFSEDNFQVLQYTDDLGFYYKDGYGHDINWGMTSPLIREMAERFSGLEDGTSQEKVFIYISHSEATNTVLPVLGLYNDSSPLVASDWPAESHLWQTSDIVSFSHNIALLGLHCPAMEEEHQVMALHMERQVVMPSCGQLLCPLSTFRSKVLQPILEVDFEEICNHELIRPGRN